MTADVERYEEVRSHIVSDPPVPGFTLDTNIFIYALDRAADSFKRERAKHIVQAGARFRSRVPLQCINEFCYAVVKKKYVSAREAALLASDYISRFRSMESTEQDTLAACQLRLSSNLSYWDALIVVVAARFGCEVLLSEDMHHGFRYGSLQILNPFVLNEGELVEVLRQR